MPVASIPEPRAGQSKDEHVEVDVRIRIDTSNEKLKTNFEKEESAVSAATEPAAMVAAKSLDLRLREAQLVKFFYETAVDIHKSPVFD